MAADEQEKDATPMGDLEQAYAYALKVMRRATQEAGTNSGPTLEMVGAAKYILDNGAAIGKRLREMEQTRYER